MFAISLPGITSSAFKPALVFPIHSFVARCCFLSLRKILSKHTKSLAEDLHVGDVVVHGLCIFIWVSHEVCSNCGIIVKRENAICKLQIHRGLV